MTRYEIKPLELGGILDHTVALVKNNLLLLIGVAAVVYVPMGLFNGFYTAAKLPEPPSVFSDVEAREAYQEAFLANSLVLMPINLVLVWVGAPLTYGAMIWAIAGLYLGERMSVGEAWRQALRHGVSLVGANIMYMLVVGLGIALCVIPGAIFALWFMFYGQGVMLEKLRASTAMTRSKELMKGNMLTGFVLGLILFVISIAINGAAAFIGQPYVATLVQVTLQLIVLTFTTTASTVFYFSCRCKNDDFDMLRLAESVAASDSDANAREATF